MDLRQLTDREYDDVTSRILYEDNHILIMNKKAGEIVQGDKTNDETLCDLCKSYIAIRGRKPGNVFLGVTHRLDRPVSGVTVFAKTSKALSRLNEMFRNGEMHKAYWALVCSPPPQQSAMLVNQMYRIESQNKSYICHGTLRKDAKLAKLEYRMLGQTDRYWLLEVILYTGRHHQIRCQLADIGCVIKGDLKYGARRSNPDGGICLHARRISFVHPVKKTDITVEADVPPTWKGINEIR